MLQIVPGRRFFIFGCVGLILFGVGHGLAIVNSWRGPANEQERMLMATMENTAEQLGPLRATAWGAMQTLSLSYAILLGYAGVINLLMLGPAIAANRLLPLTIANVVLLLLILIVSIWHQLLPPMVFSAAVAGFFAASMFRQRGPYFDCAGVSPGAGVAP